MFTDCNVNTIVDYDDDALIEDFATRVDNHYNYNYDYGSNEDNNAVNNPLANIIVVEVNNDYG